MPDMALIHYTIDDDLHRRAKAAAAYEGQTLKAFLEGALEQAATKAETAQARRRAK